MKSFKFKTYSETYDVKYNKGKYEIGLEGCHWSVKLDEYYGVKIYLMRSIIMSFQNTDYTKDQIIEWSLSQGNPF